MTARIHAAPANACPHCSESFDSTDFPGFCSHCGYIPGQGAD
ncbi:hypothetical protein [Halomicrobium urmianum]|nr:hypothetical protein [Halomicrobium urmianum]